MRYSIWRRLWRDERAFVVSSELILISTIAVIGLIVGLVIYRDAIVQELGDTGAAIGQVNQSYGVEILSGTGVTVNGNVVTISRTYGSLLNNNQITLAARLYNFEYIDASDVCDGQDVANTPPAGISVNAGMIEEGDPLLP